jgi:hypothetical protein
MVLGGVDQNNALATIRSGEVLADPTTLQALEARAAAGRGHVDHRPGGALAPLRLQPTDVPGSRPTSRCSLVKGATAPGPSRSRA